MPDLRFIAGSGRSGTTWVQDTLADANDLRPIFEPLHPWVSAVGLEYSHRALRVEEEHPDLLQFMADVCAGRGPQLWARYRRHPQWLFPPVGNLTTRKGLGRLQRAWVKFIGEFPTLYRASRRPSPLIKCIRSNLMLGWLTRHGGARVVLIVRHPGAVIESELRGDWKADRVLEVYRKDDTLHEMTQGRYRPLLARSLEPVEALATRWVVENQFAVERAAADGVTVVHYERLKSSPDEEWPRLCQALDLPRVPSADARAKPSQQSATNKPVSSAGTSGPPEWMRRLTPEQTRKIQGVLDEVGFKLYSMHDPAPRSDGADQGSAHSLERTA